MFFLSGKSIRLNFWYDRVFKKSGYLNMLCNFYNQYIWYIYSLMGWAQSYYFDYRKIWAVSTLLPWQIVEHLRCAMPRLTQKHNFPLYNSHLTLEQNMSTVYNLFFLFAVTSAERFLDIQMPFDLHWIEKDWEVPRIKNNSKYLEKYKIFQLYGHLRVRESVTQCRPLSITFIYLISFVGQQWAS